MAADAEKTQASTIASDDTVAITGDVRGLTRRWRRRVDEPSPEQTSNASFTAPVKRDLVDRVLAARGITGDAVEPFLNPSLHALHDPALLPGAEVAAERILSAAAAREPIVIYGDYDVDGVTATAILVRTLRAIDPEAAVSTYVPHRVDEGYGLNVPAIRSLADSGARVIVSVDCGVTAVEPARVARELGVDLIITDHHNPPASAKDLPEATAIVHPSLPGTDQQYPFAELCGAGVAYKLAWRMASIASGDGDRVRPDLRVLLVELLAFAALGTIADVVPLEGENRVLARFGLARCKHTPFTGLRALVEACGLAGENIDAMGVGFKLAPRLNACGRLGTAQDAIDLFLTSDPEAAARIADDLNTQNNERRQTATRILDEALELAVSHGMDKPDQRAVVLADPGWHPGVVGIVCSRLVERLCRPVVLLQSRDDDELGAICAGSGRSITGFNLHAALAACSEHLMTFGGHDAAAGLKLKHDNLDAFREAFVAHANERLTPDDLVAHAAYDTDATIEELSVESVGALERMGPFGRGNPGVRLRLRNVRVAAPPRIMGQRGTHLALQLEDGRGHQGAVIRCIGWGWAEHADRLARGVRVDALVTPKCSTWNGRTTCEPELVDLRLLDDAHEYADEHAPSVPPQVETISGRRETERPTSQSTGALA